MTRLAATALFMLVLVLAPQAIAVPTLQLQIEGGTYDTTSETWVVESDSFTLDVMGTATPAWAERIEQVTLYVAIPSGSHDADGWLHIDGLAGGNNSALVEDMDIEIEADDLVYGNGDLSPHGIYPTYFTTISLPQLLVEATGTDIQRYAINFGGFAGIHFDLSGVVLGEKKSNGVTAPYSHDAEAHAFVALDIDPEPDPSAHAPEPATALLFAIGLTSSAIAARRRKNRTSREA